MNWTSNLMKILARGAASLSPTCKQATRLQSKTLEHKLPFPQRLGLQLHLLLCKWCRRYGKQIRFLRDAAQEHPEELAEPVPGKLSADARQRIKQKLHDHS